MSQYASTLMRVLDQRGYIHQATDAAALDALAQERMITGYIGFDPTAPSLHVGSLVQIMLLRRLQQAGHQPIALMGGGTGMIGDPSGKDRSRQMITAETIAANIASIQAGFAKMLRFGEAPGDATMIDNAGWLNDLNYVEMLRDVGPHFTINRMLTFDSVKSRLDREQPLTFLEFNYMILQAYDFRVLAQTHDCRLQFGGSDQWGNIVNGVELARRMDGAELYGLTTPLLTTADGTKMGKTAGGAVWLNEDHLSAYDFWQYWRNVDDRDVGRFLRLFTDLPLDRIAELEGLEGGAINDAKIVLADEVTELVRGKDAAISASATAAQTFAGDGAGDDLPTLAVGDDGMRIGAVLTGLGFTASGKDAKRKLAEGAVKIDDVVITDPGHVVHPDENQSVRLSLGKKKHAVITR